MATVNSIQQAVDSLRKAFDTHVLEDQEVYKNTQHIQMLLQDRTATIENIQEHMKNMDERLQVQESEAKANRDSFKENNAILKSVQETVNSYEANIKHFLSFLKWLATIVALVLASVISTWIISHHP